MLYDFPFLSFALVLIELRHSLINHIRERKNPLLLFNSIDIRKGFYAFERLINEIVYRGSKNDQITNI